MKFKKIFIAISLGTALVLGGCSQQKKAEPVLTKNQVVKKTQKSLKSGQVIQSIRLSTDTATQLVSANTNFGGNPTVFHISNQTTSKGKTQTTEEWVNNSNNVYLNGRSTWYKTDYQKLSGHSYAELLDAVVNNQTMLNPNNDIVKAFKLKRNKKTYTLTATIKDKAVMKKAADPIFSTTAQSAAQEKIFRRIQKYGKYQNMTIKVVVKNKKMTSYNLFINMKLGKLMKVRLGQSYGNFGGNNDFLKLPDSALNAKPLPKSNTKSK